MNIYNEISNLIRWTSGNSSSDRLEFKVPIHYFHLAAFNDESSNTWDSCY